MPKKNEQVCLVCIERVDEDGAPVLSFTSYGNGTGIRVYERDKYDSRAGTDLPFFALWRDARAWLLANLGHYAQVSVKTIVDHRICEKREFAL
jgi:hypothetical protein